jgi:hypothetical protein
VWALQEEQHLLSKHQGEFIDSDIWQVTTWLLLLLLLLLCAARVCVLSLILGAGRSEARI